MAKNFEALKQTMLEKAEESGAYKPYTDLKGKKCIKCGTGKYAERSQYDDMDGRVTCGKCGHRPNRQYNKDDPANK